MSKKLGKGIVALRAQDIQTGLQDCSVPKFRTLLEVGWAARIAICLRSVGPVEVERLRLVALHLFGVNQWGFEAVIAILQEVGYIRIIGADPNRHVVPQNIPYFNDLYPSLGEIAADRGLNEHEELSIALLDALSKSPLPRDRVLDSLGADKQAFREVLEIGSAGSYVSEILTPDGGILTSPMYFSEKPDDFARIVAKYGDRDVKRVMQLLREYPGSPLALLQVGSIGDTTLSPDELAVAQSIVNRALTQPPAIRSRGTEHFFVFTPKVGTQKIEVIEKHLYERAIAIISAIRFGQHFADWRIHSPVELLSALRDRGRLAPPSSVRDQYVRLAMLGIVRFEPPPPAYFRDVVFIDNPENRRAISLAIEMLRQPGAEPARSPHMKVVEALTSDASYVEFIRGQGLVRTVKNISESRRTADAKVDTIIGTLSNQLMKGF